MAIEWGNNPSAGSARVHADFINCDVASENCRRDPADRSRLSFAPRANVAPGGITAYVHDGTPYALVFSSAHSSMDIVKWYDDKKTFASYNHGDAGLDLAHTYSGEVFQLGGRVYAVIPAADAHLQIVDITDPRDIELKGKLPLDLDGRIDNLAVFEHVDGWYAIAAASVQLVRLASRGSAQGDSAADFDIHIPGPLSNLLEVRVEPKGANASTISGTEFTTSGATLVWKLSDTDRSSGPASFTATYDFGALNVPAAKLTIGPQSSQSRVELPLPIPQNLRFFVHSDKVELAWDAAEDLANRVTGYRIFRKGPGDSALQSYADVTGKDTKIYADADIEPDTTYEYAVAALAADSSQGEQSASKTVTTFLLSPPNSPATGLPTVTGTAQVGETLTAGTSGIADQDGLDNAAYDYQWLADDAAISGATGASYTPSAADESKTVKVRVSFTDDAGNGESLTSAATDAVAGLPPPPLTASLENAPGSHDGVNTFTFELRFSEEFSLSYKTLRDMPSRWQGEAWRGRSGWSRAATLGGGSRSSPTATARWSSSCRRPRTATSRGPSARRTAGCCLIVWS